MFLKEILKFFDNPKSLFPSTWFILLRFPFYRTAKILIFLFLTNFYFKKFKSFFKILIYP